MSQSAYHILRSRRFLPLFVTQFLGAFNDNLFRTALVTLITFRLVQDPEQGKLLVTLAGGLFILPFFLFSATAGQLADKFDKARLIRAVKLLEVGVMGLAAFGFATGQPEFLLAVLFFMGLQSAFFGPLKYGILPDHLKREELVTGNAVIEAGTSLAILFGMIVGAQTVLRGNGSDLVIGLVLGVAAAGWLASLAIPRVPAAAPGLKVNYNFVSETVKLLRHAAEKETVFLPILGISWFWLVGFVFLTQAPSYVKSELGGDQDVLTLFLTVFSVGIALGSILCERLLKGEISARSVPFGALGMAVFSLDLYFASTRLAPIGAELGLAGYLASPGAWRILIDLLLLSAAAGFFIVPLYAILQSEAAPQARARTIASNNVVNALFMVAAAGASYLLLELGFSIAEIFLVVALANVLVAIKACRLLSHHVVKGLVGGVFRLLYRVEVRGLAHLKAAGDTAVIVVNHSSFLDGPLLAALLPGRPLFAIDTHMAQRWWVRPFMKLVEAFPMDPTRPLSTKSLIREVAKGKHCVIFPEGRLTVTGSLMKVYDGPGMVADKAGATVVPVRIEGAQHSPFTRLKGKLRRRLFPKITVTVLAPRRFEVPAELKGRRRRQVIGRQLYDVMSQMIFETQNPKARSLFEALLEARAVQGGRAEVLEDINRQPLHYDRLLLGSLVLGARMARQVPKGGTAGVLLPNAAAVAVTFFGLQAFGRVPAMLNFTAGPANLLAACKAAEIRTVYTSRRFVEMARLEETAAALAEEVELVYLEDLRESLGLGDKLRGLWRRAMLRFGRHGASRDPQAPAVVLFTSGSEGTPKGVVLSHANILANCNQLAARVDFNPTDVVLNALPVFHAFGLTGGLLLPLFAGTRTFLYPSPLHYRIVPEVAYAINATILFGTDTFLTGYARVAHPYDFYALRHVFAGAEKLREETQRTWVEKFGKRILEGYGATECAPVLAVNTPMNYRAGTVGRLLPGMAARLEPVPGIAEGQRLSVSGPNVMLGYLRAENPGQLEPPPDGWYDTGDIVDIDAEGYLRILGRAKRFAKIAGEMVSLSAVETLAGGLWPDSLHAVVSLPDARKGEQLVLVTEQADAALPALRDWGRSQGATELMIPKTILTVKRLPVLGTGKTDHVAARELARREILGEQAA